MAEDKEYVGTMTLGTTTDSQDRDGEIVESWPVPPDIDRAQIDAAFAKFHGDFYQMPPMVSAIKQGGVPLYKLARQGKTVEREPRFVHVFAHEIKNVDLPDVDFRVVCSKGFYVRTYAHDIGAELGCGAHLKELRRTQSGRFDLSRAVTVDEIRTLPTDGVEVGASSACRKSRGCAGRDIAAAPRPRGLRRFDQAAFAVWRRRRLKNHTAPTAAHRPTAAVVVGSGTEDRVTLSSRLVSPPL